MRPPAAKPRCRRRDARGGGRLARIGTGAEQRLPRRLDRAVVRVAGQAEPGPCSRHVPPRDPAQGERDEGHRRHRPDLPDRKTLGPDRVHLLDRRVERQKPGPRKQQRPVQKAVGRDRKWQDLVGRLLQPGPDPGGKVAPGPVQVVPEPAGRLRRIPCDGHLNLHPVADPGQKPVERRAVRADEVDGAPRIQTLARQRRQHRAPCQQRLEPARAGRRRPGEVARRHPGPKPVAGPEPERQPIRLDRRAAVDAGVRRAGADRQKVGPAHAGGAAR